MRREAVAAAHGGGRGAIWARLVVLNEGEVHPRKQSLVVRDPAAAVARVHALGCGAVGAGARGQRERAASGHCSLGAEQAAAASWEGSPTTIQSRCLFRFRRER